MKTRSVIIILVLIKSLTTCGQVYNETKKIIPADLVGLDAFGKDVSVSGNRMIVGTHSDKKVYIYEFNGITWIQNARLESPDRKNSDESDEFGKCVAIDGDIAVVTARTYGWRGFNYGAAYVFEYNGIDWIHTSKLTPPDTLNTYTFGSSLAIDSNRIIIGVSSGNPTPGSAYIYEKNGGSWELMNELLADDGANYEWFGESVDIHGDLAIVGAVKNDGGNGVNSGSAYIFEFDGTNWNQTGKVIASDGEPEQYFGGSVQTNGNHIVIAAAGDDYNSSNPGSVYIYEKEGANWNQTGKIVASDNAPNNKFGYDLSIYENTPVRARLRLV